ncbi:putative dehydrogenase [Clostridium algifaecis]|uniref:Dehydrogenase n=1 Tax=Clostridium algifaecis TaxID=1472040 RepID=A0ABS4KP85_9CLOT|nr:Gfo/Idh/MocA family oxidoreductase [Clostridium algifaecis]MBP2031862.1 putative dehydrogenase [Clostridium algifaecis]
MNSIINVGLIGYGMAGQVFHAPIISSIKGFNLYKVYERKQENVQKLKNKYGDVLSTSDLDDIFGDKNIQLVVIAAPNAVHFDLASKALKSGKNVVVEKPFTVTSEQAETLIKLAKDNGKILTVNQNRRWDSDFRTVCKVINNNLLGNIVEYEAHFDRYKNCLRESTWKEEQFPGSGVLYDLGSHLIDQAQFLFGLPEKIFSNLNIQREGGKIVDNFETILDYNNLKVTLKAGMLVRAKLPHFIVLGKSGSFIKYGMDTQEQLLKEGKIPKYVENWGVESRRNWGTINTEIRGCHFEGNIESEIGDYRELYKNVYNAIMKNDGLEVTAEQAKNTIKIIELAIKSSKEKKWINFN